MLSRGNQGLAIGAALCAGALVLLAVAASAAEFTQSARDAKFIQSARRQDKDLLHYWGRLIPGGTSFNHLGSFTAKVHRSGAERPATLVPVSSLGYPDADALRVAARTREVVVGALKISYGLSEPEIMPGTLLLVYDGNDIYLRNIHGEDISSFVAVVKPAPQDSVIDPALGKLGSTSASLANILPDGTLQIYLQLTTGGRLLTGRLGAPGNAGYSKVLLEFKVPGIVTDDNTQNNELVTPKAEKTKVAPPKMYNR